LWTGKQGGKAPKGLPAYFNFKKNKLFAFLVVCLWFTGRYLVWLPSIVSLMDRFIFQIVSRETIAIFFCGFFIAFLGKCAFHLACITFIK